MTFADVSVIVPCYDTERYLGEALESACEQSPPPLEVIVIDDGSTDSSAAIAGRFGPPVRCYRQPHRGISAARNAGLAVARGALIAFLDADDMWTPGSLACRLELLAGDAAAECAAGLVEQFISPELPDDVRRTLACPPGVSRGRVTGALLMRRAAVARVGDFDESIQVGETVDWAIRAEAVGVVTRTVEQVVLRRRIHGNNSGARNLHLRVDYLRVLKRSLDRKRAAKGSEADPSEPGRRDA